MRSAHFRKQLKKKAKHFKCDILHEMAKQIKKDIFSQNAKLISAKQFAFKSNGTF